MSVVFSGTNQGRFVSTGAPTTIRLRSDVDYMWVFNQTTSVAGIPAAEVGYNFYWQRGMAQGTGIVHSRLAVTGALQVNAIAANAGFTLVDSSVNVPGAALPTAALVGAGGTLGQSLIQTANTGGMPVVAADTAVAVVRIYASVGYLQFSGIDFDVSRVVAGVSFDLLNGPVAVNGAGPGTYRIIPFDPLYYPRSRFISKIRVSPLNALYTQVTLTVTHGYTIGQVVRFIVPTVTALAYGMTEINGLTGTIVAVGEADAQGAVNTITVDIDSNGFTAFAWPLTADDIHTPAQVVPVGDTTAVALGAGVNTFSDATTNTGYIGIQLWGGILSPAGVVGDVIYWVAGKSFNV